MKAKFFEEVGTPSIEDRVNRWLTGKGKGINVTHMQICTIPETRLSEPRLVIALLYEETSESTAKA